LVAFITWSLSIDWCWGLSLNTGKITHVLREVVPVIDGSIRSQRIERKIADHSLGAHVNKNSLSIVVESCTERVVKF